MRTDVFLPEVALTSNQRDHVKAALFAFFNKRLVEELESLYWASRAGGRFTIPPPGQIIASFEGELLAAVWEAVPPEFPSTQGYFPGVAWRETLARFRAGAAPLVHDGTAPSSLEEGKERRFRAAIADPGPLGIAAVVASYLSRYERLSPYLAAQRRGETDDIAADIAGARLEEAAHV